VLVDHNLYGVGTLAYSAANDVVRLGAERVGGDLRFVGRAAAFRWAAPVKDCRAELRADAGVDRDVDTTWI
jgi:hypothetical protein